MLSIAGADASRLLASDRDPPTACTAKIYNVELGRCAHTLQHEGSVLCLSYSDGGNLLTSGSTVIKAVRVWQPVREPASPVAGVGDGETTSTPDRSALCKLCMERGLEMMLMPCRHVALCTQCAVDPRMTRCLICRDIIECVGRVYVP